MRSFSKRLSRLLYALVVFSLLGSVLPTYQAPVLSAPDKPNASSSAQPLPDRIAGGPASASSPMPAGIEPQTGQEPARSSNRPPTGAAVTEMVASPLSQSDTSFVVGTDGSWQNGYLTSYPTWVEIPGASWI
jgi:hypothetical protein